MKIPNHNHWVVVDSFIKSEVEESKHLKLMGPLLCSKWYCKSIRIY